MGVDVLLSRLPHAKRTGKDSWRCACPAHQGTNKSALSIRDAGDGKILIHCFQGCPIESILSTLGLEINDLFDTDTRNDYKNVPSIKSCEVKFYPRDLLHAMKFEMQIVGISAIYMSKNLLLSESDLSRLKLAQERILDVVDML